MTIWTIIVTLGITSFALRSAFVFAHGHHRLPKTFERALRFVPAAALSAIIFPAVLVSDAGLAVSLDNYRLIAACIAGAVAWYSKNILFTIVTGMSVLWILQAIG